MRWTPLLLADPSPTLRYLVLRDLLARPADDVEVQELAHLRASDGPVIDLLESQQENGSWNDSGGNMLKATALALTRLAYFGFGPELDAISRGADYLFAQQQPDGSWPIPSVRESGEHVEGYNMVPLQTALPLRGLAACGYATDPRAERAYTWLLDQRLPEGAWPTGTAAETYGYVAGYRRIAHSRWGCRSNTSGALICLALHPERRHSDAARRALDLLLGRETRETQTLGFEIARTIGVEPTRGFFTFFARFDLALILWLCAHVGASAEDARVGEMVAFVRGLQGPYGLWTYARRPAATRWITFDLLRTLRELDASADADAWTSAEPRTPFQPYPKQGRRY